jgi:hypothetical protein
LSRRFSLFATFCSTWHLTISAEKTKALLVNSEGCNEIALEDWKFEVVEEFKYLGVLFNAVADARTMVVHRAEKAAGAFAVLCEFVGI